MIDDESFELGYKKEVEEIIPWKQLFDQAVEECENAESGTEWHACCWCAVMVMGEKLLEVEK